MDALYSVFLFCFSQVVRGVNELILLSSSSSRWE